VFPKASWDGLICRTQQATDSVAEHGTVTWSNSKRWALSNGWDIADYHDKDFWSITIIS